LQQTLGNGAANALRRPRDHRMLAMQINLIHAV
jgi:hypothetical protein